MVPDARRKKSAQKSPKKHMPKVGNKLMPSGFLCTDFGKSILNYQWSAALYRRWFHSADSLRRKRMRIGVLETTLARCARIKNFGSEISPNIGRLTGQGGEVIIFAGDVVDCARWVYESQKTQPCVLVMSSRARLGGGYKSGAGAQEEHLYRCSSLSLLHENDAVHARELDFRVFEGVLCRGSEAMGYPFLTPWRCQFVSMASVCQPQCDGEGDQMRMDRGSRKLFEQKLQALLQGTTGETLILGAWGCGVYACPPFEVAMLIKEALKLYGRNRKVYISIIKKRVNLEAFEKVFESASVFYPPLYRRRAAVEALQIIYDIRGFDSDEARLFRQIPRPLMYHIFRWIMQEDEI